MLGTLRDQKLILHLLKIINFFFQKKYGLSDLTIRSLEDSEGILNAFEIKGKCNLWGRIKLNRLVS